MVLDSNGISFAFDCFDKMIKVGFCFMSSRREFLCKNLRRIHSDKFKFDNVDSLDVDDGIVNLRGFHCKRRNLIVDLGVFFCKQRLF